MSLLDLWQQDALRYVQTVQTILSDVVGVSIPLEMDFDAGNSTQPNQCRNLLNAEIPSPYAACQDDFVFLQTSTHAKSVDELVLALAMEPQNPMNAEVHCPGLGWQAAADAYQRCLDVMEMDGLNAPGESVNMGGGSGAGFQIYCGQDLVATFGGGGGGGLYVGADTQNFGGGGGGGYQSPPFNINSGLGCGSGNDGGDVTNIRIDGNWAEITNEQIDGLGRTLRDCYDLGVLHVLGGGGGGGGRTISVSTGNMDYCGDGYGFSFFTEPKLELADSEDGNENRVGAMFIKAETACNGDPTEDGESYNYDWSCVCATVKDIAQEEEQNGLGEAPEFIIDMDCDNDSTEQPPPSTGSEGGFEDCISAGTAQPCESDSDCCPGSTCESLTVAGSDMVCRNTPRDNDRNSLGLGNGLGGSIIRDRTVAGNSIYQP